MASTTEDLQALKTAYEAAVANDPSRRLHYVEQAIAQGRVGQQAPGEAGASAPSNYMLRPEYWDWRAQEPTSAEINAAMRTERKPLNEWGEANPFYVNPKNYETFSDYATDVLRTSPGNQASSADPTRFMSLIGTYYAGANVPSRQYTEEELQAMPTELGTGFRRGMDFLRDYAGFESTGLIPGNAYTTVAQNLGLIPRSEIASAIPGYQKIIDWKKMYDPNSLAGMSAPPETKSGVNVTVLPGTKMPVAPQVITPATPPFPSTTPSTPQAPTTPTFATPASGVVPQMPVQVAPVVMGSNLQNPFMTAPMFSSNPNNPYGLGSPMFGFTPPKG